ncbi:MAG: peptidyl-prolyl cis-trans isomerase [Clostridiales bacterium]|nr:peptidyl-prolyl cis-trans isomerase [Candidatus Cacconaster stercorequi]
MKRLLALLIAVILLVSAGIAALENHGGSRNDGLYYAATDIHPDARLLQINGRDISAEEYLYWLAYDCEYLTSTTKELDWNSEIANGITYAQYAKTDALETVKLYTVVRQWAEDAGITLSDEDQAQLEAQRQQYVAYYGSEDAYDQQIQLLGIGKNALDSINAVYFLYAHVLQQFCTKGSALYPGDDVLQGFADENGYLTVKLLYIPTDGLENQAAIDAQKSTAIKYAEELQKAKDVDAVYDKLAKKLNLEYPENGLTMTADDASLDAKLMKALAAMKEGEVSDVISCDNGYYVAIRMPLDQEAVAADYFEIQLQAARDSATVGFNEKLYDSIDAGTFYTHLQEQRTALQEAFDAATETDEGTSSQQPLTNIILPAE